MEGAAFSQSRQCPAFGVDIQVDIRSGSTQQCQGGTVVVTAATAQGVELGIGDGDVAVKHHRSAVFDEISGMVRSQVAEHRSVVVGGDGDGAGDRSAHVIVAVIVVDGDGDGAVGGWIVGSVLISDSLYQGVNCRGRRRCGVEGHDQVVTVSAVGGDVADGRGIVLNFSYIQRDTAGRADIQLVLRAPSNGISDCQGPTTQVIAVDVAEGHSIVDNRRGGVQSIFFQRGGGQEVRQGRRVVDRVHGDGEGLLRAGIDATVIGTAVVGERNGNLGCAVGVVRRGVGQGTGGFVHVRLHGEQAVIII